MSKSPPDPYLLFTGSRGLGTYGTDLVAVYTEQAIRYGAHIIVGDAEDADETVIRVANAHAYKDIQVVGGYKHMKRRTKYGENVPFDGPYPARDKWMAFRATHCMGFWDGQSSGTYITIKYAASYSRKIKVARIIADQCEWLRWVPTKGLIPYELDGARR